MEEQPTDAISNGRECLRRLVENYNFECEAGPLSCCVDFQSIAGCFDLMERAPKEAWAEAWAVMSNTDLTEGRGRVYAKYICEIEATAIRLSQGAGVQGSNGTVCRLDLWKRGAKWYGPIEIERPTDADKRSQAALDARREAEAKARSLGLTDEDLKYLRN